MEERQVTVEGETRPLPQPFFVIATQNPAHQIGTFPLPESQLDRFLLRIQLGYPDHAAERALLKGSERRDMIAGLPACVDPAELLALQQAVKEVHVADALLDYLQALLEFSRSTPEFRGGLSPRAGLALLRAAQAWALIHRRTQVIPEDVQAVLPGVAIHRLRSAASRGEQDEQALLELLLNAVAIP
jgi:MoxR-like ATPase